MSNLSELLPAGAGAKSAEFVASGTLSNGQAVVLNSDGTVSAVTQVSQSVGTPVVYGSTSYAYYITSTYHTSQQKLVVAYRNSGNSNYGTVVAGTVSGTTITFGTPQVFESSTILGTAVAYEPYYNRIIIAYFKNTGSSYQARSALLSGTSFTIYSAYQFDTGNIGSDNEMKATAAYTGDSGSRVVIAYKNNSAGKAVTAYGTSVVTFGTPVQFISSVYWPSITYDTNAAKIVISYRNQSTSAGAAVVGTISGSSISFGTASSFSANCQGTGIGFDSDLNKVVIGYQDAGNSNYGTGVVGTVSGTSISFGTPVVFESAATGYSAFGVSYDANAKKTTISYVDDASFDRGTFVSGVISGTNITFNTPTVFETGSLEFNTITSVYDPNQQVVLFSYQDVSNTSRGTSVAIRNSSDDSANFIGITDQAIANTATGAVIVQGGVSDKVTGLTTGSDYYFQSNGTLSTTVSSVPAGRALSSTSILLEG